jgi:hypothetical protein
VTTQKCAPQITANNVPTVREERVEWIKYQLRVRDSSQLNFTFTQ